MADESTIMKAVVFLVTFAAIFSFMFAYTSSALINTSTPTDDDYINSHFDIEEISTMTYWDVGSSGSGVKVYNATTWTPNKYLLEPIWNGIPVHDGSRVDFYHPDDGDLCVRIYPIDDDVEFTKSNGFAANASMVSTIDCFVVFQNWGWYDREWETITFNNILMNLEEDEMDLKADIHVDLKGGIDIIFLFPLGSDAGALLQANAGFTIVVAQSVMDEVDSTNNVWNALSALLSFEVKTGIEVLDFLISVPIYACLAFIAFYIVKELLPL